MNLQRGFYSTGERNTGRNPHVLARGRQRTCIIRALFSEGDILRVTFLRVGNENRYGSDMCALFMKDVD